MKILLRRLEERLQEEKKTFRTLALSYSLALLFVTLLFYLPFFRIIGSLDYSLPYRFFLWIKPASDPKEKDGQIRKYGYVEVYVGDIQDKYTPLKKKGVLYLIKKVGCYPGDVLTFKGGAFYCNGKRLGRAHPEAPAPPFKWNGRIPKGHYFLIGTHPRSFDSRYMGFFSLDRITGVLIPLY